MRTLVFLLSLVLIFTIPWENSIVVGDLGSISRAIGLLVMGGWILAVAVTDKIRQIRPFHLLVALFVLWNVASVLWSVDIDGTLVRIGTYFQNALMVLIIWDIYTTPATLRAGLQIYVVGASVSIVGLVLNFLSLDYAGYRRFSAANLDPNDLGMRLVIGIVIAWYLIISTTNYRRTWMLSLFNYIYVAIGIFAVILTASRTAFVGLLLASLYIVLSFSQFKFITRIVSYFALIGILVILLSLVPQSSWERLGETQASISQGNLTGRVDIWTEGLVLFAEHPILGVGSGAFRAAITLNQPPHNVFISTLTETGMIGLFLFVMTLAASVYQIRFLPRLEARLWLFLFLTWVIGASTLNWEYKKHTWLILNLIVVASATVTQDSLIQRSTQFGSVVPLPRWSDITSRHIQQTVSET
ncbi:MAG: hypothetical protein DCC55_08350 [Chloroflexi bacterium]|nr:MAG: hypothetical protein DCC55_08350 [Chloroflexota bacterium]